MYARLAHCAGGELEALNLGRGLMLGLVLMLRIWLCNVVLDEPEAGSGLFWPIIYRNAIWNI